MKSKKKLNKDILIQKIKKSQDIIRQSYERYSPDKTVIAWTGGKDSTVLLHLVRSTFQDKIPFPVMFNDSTMEFEEIYKFISKLSKQWNLNLVVYPHDKKEMEEFHKTKDAKVKMELSRIMKITAMKNFVKKYNVEAFMAGIRWDEHSSRSKESYFSKRDNHTRIHPILHFTESDIWDYTKEYEVPYVGLYDQGYRSLGEKPFTQKAKPGDGERSGREAVKEKLMERLRSLGYW